MGSSAHTVTFPSRLALALAVLVTTAAFTAPVQAADHFTFSDAYYSGLSMNQMLLAAGFAVVGVGLAVGALISGGAVPAAIAAIGAKIGGLAGLSGAAAQSYGLALLGGGSLAAGGLGIAGGAAVLAALLTFTTVAIPQAAMDYAFNKFDEAAFVERSKAFVVMPFPKDRSGDAAYLRAVESLDHLKTDEPLWSAFNRNTLSLAKEDIEAGSADPKTRTLLALITLNLGDYRACFEATRAVLQDNAKAGVPPETATFPTAVNAVCRLGLKETDAEAVAVLEKDIRTVLRNELNQGKDQFVVIWLAAFMDRYVNRDDLLDDRVFRKLLSYATIIEDPAVQYQYVMLVSARFNLKLNEYSSIVKSMYENRANSNVVGHPDAAEYVAKYASAYRKLSLVVADMDSFVGLLDPKLNYHWGSRWYYEGAIATDAQTVATLRESLGKHREQASQVSDWADGFIRAQGK